MIEKAFLNPNRIWLTIVLLHMGGSIMISLLSLMPFGGIIAATGIWILLFYIKEKKMKYMGICIVGWLITIFTMYSLNSSFQGTILLNELLFLYIIWSCQKAYVKPIEYCHLKKISVKSIFLLIIAAIFLFIMADYVNACSMLVFQNLLDASLEEIVDRPLEAIIAVAVMPAIIEELLFRGMIYRGVSNKKVAIIVSAILFAFLHMNFNQMCYAFIMGLAFAFIIYLTDNLTVSILLHTLFNAFTVIICCFSKTNVIQAVLRCNIAGYNLFNPVLTNTQGKIEINILILGGIIAIFSALIALYFILGIRKIENANKWMIEKTDLIVSPNKIEKWKPNISFFVGIIICISIAILYEIFL